MVLQNHNTVAARSGNRNSNDNNPHHPSSSSSTSASNGNTISHQRPVIDLLVAMIAVPILILCALQLEKNLHDMASSPESRWLVFALGIGMLIVSVIICGYVTHRMGVCIWTGPIDEAGNRVNSRTISHNNSQNSLPREDTLPPSYDSVVKFDIPPPPYDCLVIDMEQSKNDSAGEQVAASTSKTPTEFATIHI